MARQLRVQYEGAIYHLMSRGDRREEIFRDDLDPKSFLQTLGAACKETGWHPLDQAAQIVTLPRRFYSRNGK